MNRINKFLILFFIFVFFIIGIVWQILQTEQVGSIVSKEISKRISRDFKAKFKFNKIQIQLFPPATILKNVSVLKEDDEGKKFIEINARSLGIYLGFLDIFSNRPSIDKVRIEDGELITFLNKGSESSLAIKDKKNEIMKASFLFDKYKNSFLENLPLKLKSVELINVETKVNDNFFLIEECILEFLKKSLNFKVMAENINLKKELGLFSRLAKDSLKMNFTLSKDQLKIQNLEIKNNLNVYTYRGDIYEKGNEIKLRGKAKYLGDLGTLATLATLGEKAKFIGLGKKIKGFAHIEMNINGSIINPNLNYKIHVDGFESPWAKMQEIKLQGEKKGPSLMLNSLNVRDDKSVAHLVSKSEIYNFQTKEILANGPTIKLKDFFTNKALYVVRKSLNSLKGYMTGKVSVNYKDGHIFFDFHPGLQIRNFFLMNEKNKNAPPILANSLLKVERGSIQVLRNGGVDLDLKLSFKDSFLEAKGHIGHVMELCLNRKNIL